MKVIALTSDKKTRNYFKNIGVVSSNNSSTFLNDILEWINKQKVFYTTKREDFIDKEKNSTFFSWLDCMRQTEYEDTHINQLRALLSIYDEHGKDSLIHRMIEKYCEDKHYGFISTQTPNNDTTIYEVFPHVEDIAKLFIENATDENGIIDEEKVPDTVIIYAPDYDQYRRKNKNKPKNIH